MGLGVGPWWLSEEGCERERGSGRGEGCRHRTGSCWKGARLPSGGSTAIGPGCRATAVIIRTWREAVTGVKPAIDWPGGGGGLVCICRIHLPRCPSPALFRVGGWVCGGGRYTCRVVRVLLHGFHANRRAERRCLRAAGARRGGTRERWGEGGNKGGESSLAPHTHMADKSPPKQRGRTLLERRAPPPCRTTKRSGHAK